MIALSYSQALIYVNWLRFVLESVVHDKLYVIINVDETTVSSVRPSGRGMVATGRVKRQARWRQPRDPVDRSDVKTTLLGTVCDCADLQPLLPQVILPRYTKDAVPPRHLLGEMTASGSPLEYWHGTGGWVGSRVMASWITRVRTVVSSFNSDAWIVLILDCSTTHLNVKTIRHLRRLGVLVVFIPAKLTWLLQILDVSVFGELKERLRASQTTLRTTTEKGAMEVGSWITVTAEAIRHVLVERDWTEAFSKLGAGTSDDALGTELRSYVSSSDVRPCLPTLAQFAKVVSRAAHTENTRRVHAMIMGAHLHVSRLPPGATPRSGAIIDLPIVASASKRKPSDHVAHMAWEDAILEHLDKRPKTSGTRPHGRDAARHVSMPRSVADDTS